MSFKRFAFKSLMLLLLSSLAINNSYAQEYSIIMNGDYGTSASSAAMGDIGVALIDDDPIGMYYNPARLGLNAMNNTISFAFNPKPTEFVPPESPNFSAFAFNIGKNFSNHTAIPISVGIGYIRNNISLNDMLLRIGNEVKKVDIDESSNNFAFSIATEYWAKLSLGVSFRSYNSKLAGALYNNELQEISMNSNDFGFITVLPFMDNYTISDKLAADLNFSFAYSLISDGDSKKSSTTNRNLLLFKQERLGYGLNAKLKGHINETHFNFVNISLSSEANSYLINNDGDGYLDAFSKINFVDNLLKAESSHNVKAGFGWRIGFFDCLAFSYGFQQSNYFSFDYYPKYYSSGFTIESKGLTKLLNLAFQSKVLTYISDNFNLRYNYADVKRPNVRFYNTLDLAYTGAFGY